MPAIKELYKFFSARFQNVLLDYRFEVKPRWNSPEGYHQGLYEIIERYNENYEKLINDLIQIGQPLQNQNVISYEGGGVKLDQWLSTGVGHFKYFCNTRNIQA